jgi:hypothetical protein
MSSYKDRYAEILENKDTNKLITFTDELITMIECYESIYSELKDVIDNNFIYKNKNKTVFIKDIIGNTNSSKRDITIIKRN